MNKLNFRKKLVIFKNWVNTGKVAKLHEEILTKNPVKNLICTIIYLDKVKLKLQNAQPNAKNFDLSQA